MAQTGMEISVDGLSEVSAQLDQLPVLIVKVTYREALKAAGEVLLSALRPRIPTPPLKPRKDSVPLNSTLQYRIDIDSEGRGGDMNVGFGVNGHVADWLENGHRMVSHKPKLKELGFVNPQPFARPAFDTCWRQMVDAFEKKFVQIARGAIAGIKTNNELE